MKNPKNYLYVIENRSPSPGAIRASAVITIEEAQHIYNQLKEMSDDLGIECTINESDLPNFAKDLNRAFDPGPEFFGMLSTPFGCGFISGIIATLTTMRREGLVTEDLEIIATELSSDFEGEDEST